MRPSDSGQFWGVEFENRWHTGIGWGLQSRFHNLNLVLVKNDLRTFASDNKENFDE